MYFFIFKPTLWTSTKKLHISAPALPCSPRVLKPHTVMLLPLHPQKTSWKLVFGNRLANILSCLLQATEALLGRPTLSPEPSRPPLCSKTQRGRKSRSVFASHVGTQALYTLQCHCRYFCEPYKQRGRSAKRSFDNWELYKFLNPHRRILSFFSSSFFPIVCFEKLCGKAPLRRWQILWHKSLSKG